MTNIEAPADAVAHSWVERAPGRLQPYLRLMRLDRPIGSWLLFWPCVFGLALGAATQHRVFLGQAHDWWYLALFGAGPIVMRGAGCTYNDIVDRDIDARVARTRGPAHPLGRGRASRRPGSSWRRFARSGSSILLLQRFRDRRWARPRSCWSRPIPS